MSTPIHKPSFDLTSRIIEFESGESSEEEIIELFQHLVDTGMAWTLQGSYGRMAQALLENGHIVQPTEVPYGDN